MRGIDLAALGRATRRGAGLALLLGAMAAPALAGRDPPRHYAAIGAPDPLLVAAGALLGVSFAIEDADEAAIAALYRHQHAVTAILREALAARPASAGGAAFLPEGARGARLGVLRLPDGLAFAVRARWRTARRGSPRACCCAPCRLDGPRGRAEAFRPIREEARVPPFRPTRRALGAMLALSPLPAAAQAPWPARPIRFVVPWPPGGLNDLIARAFNDRVGAALGQTIVNDFKPGAGGRIGVAEVARAAPDGYVIGMGNLGPLTIFPNLYRDMPFDVARDLAPVTMFAASPLVLVTKGDFPAASVADLIARAKAQPGRLNYGSVGIGTAQHLIFEMFRQRDGVDMVHVPYRGNTDSLVALLAGDIQAMFETLPTILPAIRDGRVRALAVTTPTRVPQLPDVPTLAEAGQPGIEVSTWYAVIAPARTPDAVLDRLFAVYTQVAQTPEMQRFLAEQGLVYLPNTREGFAQRIAAETARWAALIRERGISVN